MKENNQWDKKSLRALTKTNPDWNEIAKDCVSFANAFGGIIVFGVENHENSPPKEQKIPDELPVKLQKQIQARTINVGIVPQVKYAKNGGEYLELLVERNANSIASTSNGRYYIRVDDACKPVLPDELSRLLSDKGAFAWETQTQLQVLRNNYDIEKTTQFIADIQTSDRVSNFVKNKSHEELLEHYIFVDGDFLTNLGILWVGKRKHRARLNFAPVIQFIKYDENEQKVNKIIWDDYRFNPKELIQAVMEDIADWKEGIEVADGVFRKNILNYEEPVIRELIANALVHRPYTTRGDIFLNLYHDRLETHNPGLLPLGVTPQNILHTSIQRNPHLAKVFFDLKLMEKEGSGYDQMYEILLSNGKSPPEPKEDNDRVTVTIRKRIINKQVIQFIEKVNYEFQLKPKEIICLGLIAQHNSLTAIDLVKQLGLKGKDAIRTWIGRLLDFQLIKSKGKTKGKTYYIESSVLIKHQFEGETNIKTILTHRLIALIIEDLSRYGDSSISQIHHRIGKEIPLRSLRYQLKLLVFQKKINKTGERKGTRYFIDK